MQDSGVTTVSRGNSSPDAPLSEQDIESLVAAYLAVEEKLSYEQIQRLMNTSRATVARRLQHAKQQGFLIEQPLVRPPSKEAEKSLQDRIYDAKMQQDVRLMLQGYGLRRVTIVPDTPLATGDPYGVLRRVGFAAAQRLYSLFSDKGGVVGVNWGHAVQAAVEALSQEEDDNPSLMFFPMLGDFSVDEGSPEQYAEAMNCGANTLARRAADAFRAPTPWRLTAPAVISSAVATTPEKLDTIWELVEQDVSYVRVFGRGYHHTPTGQTQQPPDPNALIRRATAIITGTSSLHADSTLASVARVLEPDEFDLLRKAGFAGDLGGHPVSDPEVKVTDERALAIVESLRNLLVSPLPDDFVRIAEEARRSDDEGAGVFLISTGKHKAHSLLALVRNRAVNELFTDRATGERMLQLLRSQ